jgi:hypothetical protein
MSSRKPVKKTAAATAPPYSAVFIEFEAMTAEETEKDKEDVTFYNTIKKFFNKNIRPFQHARLLVLDSDELEEGSQIGKRAIDDGATGRAFDCYGDKEHPKLIAADSEKWDFKGKAGGATYKANEEFMGWTDKTTKEIETFGELPRVRCSSVLTLNALLMHIKPRLTFPVDQLCKEKRTYNLISENCLDFAHDLARKILKTEKEFYNYFTESASPYKGVPIGGTGMIS